MMARLKNFFSRIKVRLTFWYIIILILVLVLFNGVLYWSMENYIHDRVREQLQIQAEKVLREVSKEQEEDGGPYLLKLEEELEEIVFKGTISAFYNQSGELLMGKDVDKVTPKIIESVESDFLIELEGRGSDEKWVVVTVIAKNNQESIGYLRLARSLTDEEATLNKLITILIFGIPLTLLLASSGGYFLAYKALKPIDQINKTAQAISHSNLSKRIIAKNSDDETGRLIDTLNDLLNRLEEAFSREKRFTSDASHELRTPIAIIRAHAEENLKGERSIKDYRHSLKVIHKQTDYMSHLVGQLLLLARSDMNQQPIEKENLDFTELVEIVIEEMEELALKKDINIDSKVEQGLNLYGDQSMLTQLLINLLDNAIKYTHPKGSIYIDTKAKNNQIKIEIKDTGIGISKEEQAYIFDRFYRVDKSRSRASGGSGLGLSICQWIVKVHKGIIELESEINQGSTFTIYLPQNKKGN
ncbi:heavy metal sensor kinase [Orenia metallireducens]|uniref:sensor histidine kinase n=1 Tax=Orenia metallireducens TaxID=1413210 RepID=UPI000D077DB4|nr:HAMP domain-containing sensor histidine kinase [Orenia metallireducens]PRX31045.1 heavy metal sensor kinase [Orenia metallireducens]